MKPTQFALMVYAVVIRGDEILATLHDRGLGAYWGLPGEWVSPGDPIETSAELAVLEQTSLDVSARRLLCVKHIIDWYQPYDTLFISLDCALKSNGNPKLAENAHPSDGSITRAAWVRIGEFMNNPLPKVERDFWNKSISVFRGEQMAGFDEVDLSNKPYSK